MNNKVKITIAVVLFVVAIGAIAYYLMNSRTEVNPEFQNPAPAELPPDVIYGES